MTLPKRYKPSEAEPRLRSFWRGTGVYHYSPGKTGPVFSIDTPPPTVSGNLHLGHAYSYSHPDFVARFWRMNGRNVFYPMGYDDNGLPTERLVEAQSGITAAQVGREAFIEKCLQVSEQAEKDYQELWRRLGLSIDWRYTYRTIDDCSRRIAQLSFINLYRDGLAYQQEAPAIWCPECRTSIAQAELSDLERESEFVTLKFKLHEDGSDELREEGKFELIATTRPELLPACVAVFVHPDDSRYRDLAGKQLVVPIFGQRVPILEDPAADPEKGTGVVMCCTFGDTTDVAWWHKYQLPLVEALDSTACMTGVAQAFSGLSITEARSQIKHTLEDIGLITDRKKTSQSVRVHERCDTPVEYIVARQWFIKVLEFKDKLLEIGEQVRWRPAQMKARYRAWVENLHWDWCISRQRYFGVPFPVWFCQECGEVTLADENQLPVDPLTQSPTVPCSCGSTDFQPEEDVMDTWATSSMTPQIVGNWLGCRDGSSEDLYQQVYPFTLRPQAHEIIRTWAFYTIVKSHFHFASKPWEDLLISGWGIAGEGMGKISKSRGGGPLSPIQTIERYSADAVRYWAASTAPGKDSIISEEKIKLGTKLVNKLWNVARFCEPFLRNFQPKEDFPKFTSADRWILARTQQLIRQASEYYRNYEYAAAKSETEAFFWRDLADNYLEMCKVRLYASDHPLRGGARFSLFQIFLATIKLLAPILPYVTEEIYRSLYAPLIQPGEEEASIHNSPWPAVDPAFEDQFALSIGEILISIAITVRRYKSEQNLALGSELSRLQLTAKNNQIAKGLFDAIPDLMSVTRAKQIEIADNLDPSFLNLESNESIEIALLQ